MNVADGHMNVSGVSFLSMAELGTEAVSAARRGRRCPMFQGSVPCVAATPGRMLPGRRLRPLTRSNPVMRQPDRRRRCAAAHQVRRRRGIMRRIAVISSLVFVALPLLACAEADAGSAASADAATTAGAPDGPPLYYLLSGPAKRYCSGIWVSERRPHGGALRQRAAYRGAGTRLRERQPRHRHRRGQTHRHRLPGRRLGPRPPLRRPGLYHPPARHRRRVLHARARS